MCIRDRYSGRPHRVRCGPPRAVGLLPAARLRRPASGLPLVEAPSAGFPARPFPAGRHSGLGREA
eukprot:7488939-Alexandrium_andersonii.AAC.1